MHAVVIVLNWNNRLHDIEKVGFTKSGVTAMGAMQPKTFVHSAGSLRRNWALGGESKAMPKSGLVVGVAKGVPTRPMGLMGKRGK